MWHVASKTQALVEIRYNNEFGRGTKSVTRIGMFARSLAPTLKTPAYGTSTHGEHAPGYACSHMSTKRVQTVAVSQPMIAQSDSLSLKLQAAARAWAGARRGRLS